MDRTNLSQINNGIKSKGTNKMEQSNQVVHTHTFSEGKQTSNANSNEPKRVIKQIVSLDSKKLKALGIESNILSALTKFNGKERSISKFTTSNPVKNARPPTASSSPSSSLSASVSALVNRTQTESPVQNISPSTATISPVPSIVTACDSSALSKSPETASTKKIHVLSNVLLNEHKLNLKDFTAIASSTPVTSANISHVSQVPNHNQIAAPIECASIVKIENDRILLNTTDIPIVMGPTNSTDELFIIKNETSHEPQKTSNIDGQSERKTAKLLQRLSCEMDSLKGFSSIDIKCSQNQFEDLKNEIHAKPMHSTMESDMTRDTTIGKVSLQSLQMQNELEIQSDQISITRSSSPIGTNSEKMSSCDSSSDSESDLEELKKEAQRIIENELRKSESVTVKKDIDKDRLIDDFLDSTISSFHIPFVAHTNHIYDSSGDSSSEDDNTGIVDIENECNEFEERETEGQTFEAAESEELIDESNSPVKQLDTYEAKPSINSMSQKRKIEAETNFDKTKRKKLTTKKEVHEAHDDLVQSQANSINNAINEQIPPLPVEMPQGKIKIVHNFCFSR